MLAAVPMLRVRVQVPRRDAASVTHALARLGLLHLIDIAHGKAENLPEGTQAQLARSQALRTRVRRVADRIGLGTPPLAGRIDEPLVQDFSAEQDRIETMLAPIESAVNAIWEDRLAATARASDAAHLLRRAVRLERAQLDVGRMLATRFVTLRVAGGSATAFDALATFMDPAPCAVIPLESSSAEVLSVIAVPSTSGARLDAALRLVPLETLSKTMLEQSASAGALEQAVRTAREQEADATARLEGLQRDHGAAVADLSARAEACLLLLQAQINFGATGRFFVISGWIPKDALAAVRAAVASACPTAIIDAELPEDLPASAQAALRIPILHRNPLLLRPFQPLIDLYGTPAYREVQPTAFFAVSFLLMFGLMFGDVGHGSILAAAGYCLFRFVPRFLDYGILLMEAGLASVMFGLLYGSVFGVEGALPVLWLSPLHDLQSFMRIAIGLGAVLVSLGLLLNVINNWRAGERATALVSVHGLFGAFLYWTVLALLARAVMPQSLRVPGWLLGVLGGAAVALVALRAPLMARLQAADPWRPPVPRGPFWLRALEGSVELVDALFAFFANTISFVRIAAFAAVHAATFVALFAVSDTLAGFSAGRSLSIAALVVGNIVLVLLEGLTVSVQVLRLEYYEFFGKFFRGGGEQYRPLMLRSSKQGGIT